MSRELKVLFVVSILLLAVIIGVCGCGRGDRLLDPPAGNNDPLGPSAGRPPKVFVSLDASTPISKTVYAGSFNTETTVLRMTGDYEDSSLVEGIGLKINGSLPPLAVVKATIWENGKRVGECVFPDGSSGIAVFYRPIYLGDRTRIFPIKVDFAQVSSYLIKEYKGKTVAVNHDGRVLIVSDNAHMVYINKNQATRAPEHLFFIGE